MSDVEIPIRIECELTDGWGSERWDIKDVKDERTNTEIGDIGIYDFDAHSDFPETLMDAVMANLEEYDYFEPERLFYSVTVNIYNGEIAKNC